MGRLIDADSLKGCKIIQSYIGHDGDAYMRIIEPEEIPTADYNKEIIEVINDEMKEILSMQPDKDENEVTFNVKRQHWFAECKAIKNRIIMRLE